MKYNLIQTAKRDFRPLVMCRNKDYKDPMPAGLQMCRNSGYKDPVQVRLT